MGLNGRVGRGSRRLQRLASPTLSVVAPLVRRVLGLYLRSKGQFVQRVEKSAMRHEQQHLAGVAREPSAYDANGACARLVPLLGVRRQMTDQAFVRLQAELRLYLADDQPFEGAEMPLLQ